MACCSVALVWPGASAAPAACRAPSRLRSDSLLSDVDLGALDELVATDTKLSQWGARLRLRAEAPAAPRAAAACPEGGAPPCAGDVCRGLAPVAEEAPGAGLPQAMSLGLGLLGGGLVPQWLRAAGPARRPGGVGGTVAVRGSLGEGCLAPLREALRGALAAVLAPAAGPDLEVAVAAGCWVVGPEAAEQAARRAAFAFEALLADPHDRAPVVEVLRLEADSGGARRLLPLLANAAGAVGHLALRIELAPS